MRGTQEPSFEYIPELCTEHAVFKRLCRAVSVSRLQRSGARYMRLSVVGHSQRQAVRADCKKRW